MEIDHASQVVPIPDLDPQGFVNQTEGPADYTLFARPKGVVKAVIVFVDFPDARGDTNPTTPAGTAEHLLGAGAAQRQFHDQSYGRLSLEVTVREDLGWRRMPKASTEYSFATADSHRDYISAAARLFRPSELRFSDYRFVFVVAPQAAAFPASPAFNQWPGDGATSPSGEIRLAVTFGTDSYSNRYINLVHEVGHLFGLPDLYTYDDLGGHGAEDSKAGCWDIMSDIFRSVTFFGWHRHKNGWLPASRSTYLAQTTQGRRMTLHPLSGPSGLSLIVLPVDDVHRPSKVIAIELAEPVLGGNGAYWGEGVLVYTVDATVPGGSAPVTILPKIRSSSPDFGFLFEAPYHVGDVKQLRVSHTAVTVRVLRRVGSAYDLSIDYRQG